MTIVIKDTFRQVRPQTPLPIGVPIEAREGFVSVEDMLSDDNMRLESRRCAAVDFDGDIYYVPVGHIVVRP